MRSITLVLALAIAQILPAQTDPAVQAIWSKIERNEHEIAIQELKALVKKQPTNQEALASLVLLGEVLPEAKVHDKYFEQLQALPDASPALVYSLIQNSAGLDEVGVLDSWNQTNAEALIKNPKAHPTNQAYALNYKVFEQLFIWKQDSAEYYEDRIKNLRNWAFLGPFEDEMNSAFEKPNDALIFADKAHVFTNENGTKLNWFEPKLQYHRGQTVKSAHFSQVKKLVFAQSFVQVEAEKEYLMSLGYSGNLKVWIDDVLVHSVKDTKLSLVDAFNYKVTLSKGTHRVLVQFGSYNSSNQVFTLRFRDVVTGQPVGFTHTAFASNYAKGKLPAPVKVEHFALKTLEANAKQQPNSLYHALLLSNAYSSVFDMTNVSKVLQAQRTRVPNNALVCLYLLRYASRTNNDVEQAKQKNHFKEIQPFTLAVLEEELGDATSSDNKTRALALIDSIELLYKGTPVADRMPLRRALIEGEDTKIIDEIRRLYKKDKYDTNVALAMYRVLSEIDGKEAEAIKLLEGLDEKYYNNTVYSTLSDHYKKKNKVEKYLQLADKYYVVSGGIDAYLQYEKAAFYQTRKKFKEAQAVLNEIALTRPYDSRIHEETADIYTDAGDKEKAKEAYVRAIDIIPYSLTLKNKLYKLEYNKEIFDEIEMYKPETELAAYKAMNKTPEEGHDYTILFDEEAFFQLGNGASATVRNYMAQMHTQNALEEYQRMEFGDETLEKAQIYKKDGKKIDAERHGGTAVFTGLEIGDYIYVKYRGESEVPGPIGRYFSHSFGLNGYRPTVRSRFHAFIDTVNVQYQAQVVNGTQKPKQRSLRQFRILTYEDLNPQTLPIEPFSPAYSDMAPVVHITSKTNWSDIVDWYDNLTNIQSEAEFDDQALMQDIFPKGLGGYSNKEKAVQIYNYIIKNIQYSSISFRQSGIVPQAAADVYHTKIGDCKDVSTLYKSIANKAGLKANLVLVSTAGNGSKDIVAPGLGFDHCIVKVEVDGKQQYLELTNPNLGYGCFNYDHYRSNILDISQSNKTAGLKQLVGVEKEQDYLKRSSKIQITAAPEAKIETTSNYGGSRAASIREGYHDVLPNQQKERLTKALSDIFQNGVTLNSYDLDKFEEVKNVYQIKTTATAPKALIKIGSNFTFKLPFRDAIFTTEHFSLEERKNVFCLDRYESCDWYEESFDIALENGLKFDELPENASLSHLDMTYSLQFQRISDAQIKVTRKFTGSKLRIPPTEYAKLREYANAVIELENTYLAIKKVK